MATKNQNKTKPTGVSIAEYLKSIADVKVRADTKRLIELFESATKAKAKMWGNMVGFGSYEYSGASGRQGEWYAAGFAARKGHFTIYSLVGYTFAKSLLKDLGPHSFTGKSCLQIKDLDAVKLPVLKKIVAGGILELKKKYTVSLK